MGRLAPLVGGAVFALLLGIVLANSLRLPPNLRPGTQLAAKKLLQAGIVLLGASLNLGQVVAAGRQSLAVMLITLALALAAAALLGRWLGVSRNLTRLVGVGTAICGGSAIAAVAPIIEAEDEEVAFSISTVFLFNLVAVLTFPAIGHLLGLGQTGFGIWAGTAINDTSSVVAAGLAYGDGALRVATVTKLARTLMILPIALAFVALVRRESGTERAAGELRRIMPWFIFGFLALVVINSLGLLGPTLGGHLGELGRFLIVVALAGIGLGTNLRRMAHTGARPVLLGLLTWAVVAVGSLMVQAALAQW